ncbi:oxaloacetate decarboxylase [Bordetella sp. BOR01]|uniref:isocitrate lyase/PEP mutase family protein n=1 Tax=Bordetella sp. BOR01 TaxID=2854779 RepID=UPI001C45BD9A|nr:isocitrate lyase/PEP mutase family protein [Bordetella sp. BOR01]MBV7482377.1 isocitrate lyase/PEP mutase family protein [Bordetella sp. BOR01]
MTTLKARLAQGEFIGAPGVFDMISAKLADRTSAPALYVTGYGTVASHLGLPDAGLATYSQMLERIQTICEGVSKPVIADADTGYGGLLNVRHTVRGYEKAGVAAIQIEDQQFPKKCGHTPQRQVVPTAEMVQKIRVASDARSRDDFLIVARTDARSGLGLDEALRRGEAYVRAGADILFIESPESREELQIIGRSFDVPLLANMVHGGKTPLLSQDELTAHGFQVAIYPSIGFLAVGHALAEAYAAVVAQQPIPVGLYDFPAFHELMGFPDVWAFERLYAESPQPSQGEIHAR